MRRVLSYVSATAALLVAGTAYAADSGLVVFD